jgi:hypothetical protein
VTVENEVAMNMCLVNLVRGKQSVMLSFFHFVVTLQHLSGPQGKLSSIFISIFYSSHNLAAIPGFSYVESKEIIVSFPRKWKAVN